MTGDGIEPEYIGVRDAARRLNLHENTVRNWIRDGKLPSARIPGSKAHWLDERDVERLLRQRGQAVTTVDVEHRRTIGPELIDASELALWAKSASRDAQGAFPELMRRLLESSPGVTNISIRSGDGVALPGWDGQAHSQGSPYLPDGLLRFEFGVSQQPKRKADEDYQKRSKSADAKEVVFIFATPRRWRDAGTWADARRAERVFRDVRVLDGDDLEGWLKATPAAHYWISERLGRKPQDAQTLQQWWAQFRRQTNPELPGALFLAGRDEAREALAAFTEKSPDVIFIQAPWQDEAVAFVAASLQWIERHRGETAPPLVVTSKDVWDRVAATSGHLILIPLFDEPQIDLALRHGHHVVMPLGSGQTIRGASIELAPPHRDLARQSLESDEISFERAYELSALARRNMPSLVRELARDRRLRDPKWANPDEARIFAPLVLIGSWSTTSDEDLSLVSEMVDESWPTIERHLRHWLWKDDRPFVLTGETQWHLASAEEAFLTLYRQLTSEDLRRWSEIAPHVLLEVDPVLDLEPDEQYLAGIKGVRRAYSSVLRRGIADGLALIGSLRDITLSGRSSGEDEARRVVGEVLAKAEENEAGRTWQSLADVLPLLAEASPHTFLDAVTQDLARESPILKTMFQDGDRSSWLTSSSPHTGLLWALETICWSSRYLAEAAVALAQLQAIDPGGRLGNRPLGSLRSVFPGWIRHTSASLSEKVDAIEQVCGRVPSVGWDLVLSLWPSSHASVMPPASPRHSDWAPDSRDVPVTEWIEYIGHLVRLAIEMAGTNPARWGAMAHRIAPLPPSDRDRVLSELDDFSLTHTFTDQERLDLWEQLHEEVARHRQFKDATWAMDEAVLIRLDTIAERIEPAQNVERFAHLFDWRPNLPDVERGDFAAQEDRLKELRTEAVRETIATGSIDGLRALAARAKVSHFLGWVVGEVAPDELTPELATWLDSDERRLMVVAQNWARQKTESAEGVAWFRHMLTTPELQPVSRRGIFVKNMPPRREFWDNLAEVDPDLADEYWRATHLTQVPPSDLPRAINELLARERPWIAINLIASELHRPDQDQHVSREDVERTLDAAMRASPNDATSQSLGYEIGVILDYLEAAGSDASKVAGYEFVFFRLIEDHREPRALFKALSDDPDTFVDLVSRVYRGKNESERQLDEQAAALAHQAWWVLAHWNGVPGLDDSAMIDEEHLTGWVNRARLAFAEKDRADIGDEQIGQVLSNSPPGTDEIWPAEPVRGIVETTGNANIESGLFTGHMNNRGPTSRSIYEGGRQEHDLADRHREWSRTTASKWPRTSRLLRLLAESYERQARQEDARAEIDADTR